MGMAKSLAVYKAANTQKICEEKEWNTIFMKPQMLWITSTIAGMHTMISKQTCWRGETMSNFICLIIDFGKSVATINAKNPTA